MEFLVPVCIQFPRSAIRKLIEEGYVFGEATRRIACHIERKTPIKRMEGTEVVFKIGEWSITKAVTNRFFLLESRVSATHRSALVCLFPFAF